MQLEVVQYEKRGRIAYVTMNRPAVMNALHPLAHEELDRVWNDFAADPDCWVAVLTGAGEKAFSPGKDIGEFANERANKAQAIGYGAVMHGTARALAECRHPLVAQIGPAYL